MSNQLQENLDAILLDKNTNLKPENLKEGVTCLGIEGTMNSGIDTSDANATANDIVRDKTAYVNGEKITGTIQEMRNQPYLIPVQDAVVTLEDRGGRVNFTCNVVNNGNSYVVDGSNKLRAQASYEVVAEEIGLTADKIKAGETILGITGTYTGENDVSL